MRSVKYPELIESSEINEAFLRKDLLKVAGKMAPIIAKKLGTSGTIPRMGFVFRDSDLGGEFEGYDSYLGSGKDKIRINFTRGGSASVHSITIFRNFKGNDPVKHIIIPPQFNIVQVMGHIVYALVNNYGDLGESYEHSYGTRLHEAESHKQHIHDWMFSGSANIIAEINKRGSDWQTLLSDYLAYLQRVNARVGMPALTTFQATCRKVLEAAGNDRTADNVPHVSVMRGSGSAGIPVVDPQQERIFEDDLVSNEHIHKFERMKFRFQQILNGTFKDNGMYIYGRGGIGKAQPLYSKVLTVNGFKTMGEMEVGDEVITPDGSISKVQAVFPQGLKDIYEVTFADGSKVRSCNEHLWKVYKQSIDREHIMELSEIIEEGVLDNQGRRNFSVPLINEAVDFKNFTAIDLPIDPYVLGVLLGDGCLKQYTPTFTNVDSFIIEKVSKSVTNNELKVNSQRGVSYSITNDEGIASSNQYVSNPNRLTESLRNLNLMGKGSKEKFIPEMYLYSSVQDRYQLLQGLMDTDGFISKTGVAQITLVNKPMIEQIRFLIKSLGGWASITEKKLKDYDHIAWTLTFDSIDAPVTLPRKLERWNKKKMNKQGISIVDISYIGKEEAQCISLDSEEGLYITDDFIITHNSHWAKKMLVGQPGVFYTKTAMGGYTGLLQVLYDHRDEDLIILDDSLSDNDMSEQKIQLILKSALESGTDDRWVRVSKKDTGGGSDTLPPISGTSADDMLDFSNDSGISTGEGIYNFKLKAKVVVITNYSKVPQSIQDRCEIIAMLFTEFQVQEIIKAAMEKIRPHDVPVAEKLVVMEWIQERSRNKKYAMQPLSFRLFSRAVCTYVDTKDKPDNVWQEWVFDEIRQQLGGKGY